MKKLLVLTFIVFSVLLFSTTNINLFFSVFWNYPPSLPDYGLWIETGIPYADVYVDGYYAGQTNIFGYIILAFEEEGYHNIKIEAEDFLPFTKTFYIDESGLRVYISLEKAGKLMILSNVYPVSIYINGTYFGSVNDENEVIKIPTGSNQVVFSSPGYEYIEEKIFISFKEIKIMKLKFKPKKLEMNIETSYTEFSPNNDWFRDSWKLRIYLSTYANLKIEISKQKTGEVIYEKVFEGKPYYNNFTWKGENADNGVYLVKVIADNGREKVVRTITVTVDRNKYMYIKQIVLISLLSILIFVIIGL
ncbi:MAG: PEGA domain-containing protein [Thermosipho sp. (in: Bacteria)]|nr:PEGA domain-containing protein [Thermosipho sp. (in: thermotogales)]